MQDNETRNLRIFEITQPISSKYYLSTATLRSLYMYTLGQNMLLHLSIHTRQRYCTQLYITKLIGLTNMNISVTRVITVFHKCFIHYEKELLDQFNRIILHSIQIAFVFGVGNSVLIMKNIGIQFDKLNTGGPLIELLQNLSFF